MAHIVTLKQAPGDAALVYLCTPQDMASTMGGFGPARYVGSSPPVAGASYVITADDLPRFRVYCANRGVQVMDAPAPASSRPLGRHAPLPECRHCGQPARRAARLEHCPNCGAPWDAIEVGAPYAGHQQWDTITCDQCSSQTPSGFSHCVHCGGAHA